ncbi:ABC transporter permease subunit [Phytoactinopolyspora alkaliphila]|uniref:ABC transporter permease subunit n=1 Tax=Phytoactinopolyspora alkaliphila TaxID=1783498 RepID=A0A6N9YFJ8_9ACTN|nr:ABC transporter permease subunit [Phytoactinopolyspora alkaliphila]NED93710.1 ABC transporter permease subunit [Phytoactinopolyspora alkaliphila]
MSTATAIDDANRQGESAPVAPITTGHRDPILAVGKICAWATLIICLLPIPVVFAVSTTRSWREGFWAGGFTLDWLVQGWERISGNFSYSLQIAAIVLVLNVAIGYPAAWLLARRRFPGRQVAMAITTMPIAIPGIALALGLILSYPTLRPGGYLLVAGHLLYTAPFFIGTLTPALADGRVRDVEQVAMTLGAGAFRRWLTVTVPQTRTALLAATIMVLTLSLGEFNVSFFLFTPVEQPLPVELYSSYITNRLEIAAASTMWFLALVVPAAVVLELAGGTKVGQA